MNPYQTFSNRFFTYAAVAALSLSVSAVADARSNNGKGKSKSTRNTGVIEIVVSEGCDVYVQSEKDISNITLQNGEKFEYEYDAHGGAHPITNPYRLGTYEELIAGDLDDFLYVKAGNNGNRGRGEKVEITHPPVDACEEEAPVLVGVNLVADVSAVNFGLLALGEASEPQTVVITNQGSEPAIEVFPRIIALPFVNDFSFRTTPGSCLELQDFGQGLDPNSSCTITLTMQTINTGSFSDNQVLTFVDPTGFNTISFPVTGTVFDP